MYKHFLFLLILLNNSFLNGSIIKLIQSINQALPVEKHVPLIPGIRAMGVPVIGLEGITKNKIEKEWKHVKDYKSLKSFIEVFLSHTKRHINNQITQAFQDNLASCIQQLHFFKDNSSQKIISNIFNNKTTTIQEFITLNKERIENIITDLKASNIINTLINILTNAQQQLESITSNSDKIEIIQNIFTCIESNILNKTNALIIQHKKLINDIIKNLHNKDLKEVIALLQQN